MSLLTASYLPPQKLGLLARLGAWMARRPTTRQKRATLDVIGMSPHLRRDVGFELFIHSERRP